MEFTLLEKALQEYSAKQNEISNKDKSSLKNINNSVESVICSHDNVIPEGGSIVCTDCGEAIRKDILFDKEWRFYGDKGNSSRANVRKNEEKDIYKDVENMGFGDKVVEIANKIYFDVTGGDTYRAKYRKAIIFACVFHAYKKLNINQSYDKLIDSFGIERKVGLKGLKYVNLNAPTGSEIRGSSLTAVNLITEIMDRFSASEKQKSEVIELYQKIKNKSSILNRARPQSVASGIAFYWVSLRKKDITLKEFASKVDLSELTILKILKEINGILKSVEPIRETAKPSSLGALLLPRESSSSS